MADGTSTWGTREDNSWGWSEILRSGTMCDEEKPLRRIEELSAYVTDESGEKRLNIETLSKSGGSAGD